MNYSGLAGLKPIYRVLNPFRALRNNLKGKVLDPLGAVPGLQPTAYNVLLLLGKNPFKNVLCGWIGQLPASKRVDVGLAEDPDFRYPLGNGAAGVHHRLSNLPFVVRRVLR